MNEIEDSTIRRHNRALRAVNRGLRRKIERMQEHSDSAFLALCESDQPAEQAMSELWEKAGLICSPEDYDSIVEMAVRCIRQVFGTSGSCPILMPVQIGPGQCGTSKGFPTEFYCTRDFGHDGPCALHFKPR